MLKWVKLFKVSLLIAVQGFALEGIEPQSRSWVNWNGTEACQIDALFLPTTPEELIALVQEARAQGKKIKVIGAGHSLNAIAVPEKGSWAISLENYAQIVEVDKAKQTLIAQGGATLKQINEALAQQGLALENLGSISDQTIGGVIQTGTHGTGRNYGPFHTQILSMTVINGQGVRKTVSPSVSPLLFQAYQCGLGALGIIDTVTLRVVPAQLFHERMYPVEWPGLLDQLEELVQENEHFRFYWFPYTNSAGVWTARPDEGEKGPFPAKDRTALSRLIKEVAKERKGQTIDSIEDVLELGPSDPAIMKRVNGAFFEADYGQASERVDRSDRIFNVDCGAHSHCCAMEVAFPFAHTRSFLLELQELIEKNHFPAHTGVEVRFVRADQALISPTYSECPEDLFCFVSIVSVRPNNKPIAYQPYFAAFQKLGEKYEGRPHWGKMGEYDPAYLRRIYPQWEVFRELQKQEDPQGIFLNELTGEILERTSAVDAVPSTPGPAA